MRRAPAPAKSLSRWTAFAFLAGLAMAAAQEPAPATAPKEPPPAAAPAPNSAELEAAAAALEASLGGAQAKNPHGGETGGPRTSLLPGPDSSTPAGVDKLSALEGVAVMHEGRLKPMETFARHVLLQFSGRTSHQKQSAMQVMARILFTPEVTGDYKIFLVNNPEVAEALGMVPEKRRRYTYLQLEKSLFKLQELAEKAQGVEDEKRDLVQKEVLRVYGNVVQFLNLTRTFAYARPSPDYAVRLTETREHLRLEAGDAQPSFWDMMNRAETISRVLEGVGDRAENVRSPMETEIIGLSKAMFVSSQSQSASTYKVLPSPGASQSGWLSPPEAVAVPATMQGFRAELEAWAGITSAFRRGDQEAFEKSAGAFAAAIDQRAYQELAPTHFRLEILYQKTQPFFQSLALYWLALLGTFAYFLFGRLRWLYRASLAVFLAGFAIHVAGIVARIIIMHRPPVTSLYETFPFVAAVSMTAAMVIERLNSRRRGAGIGLLSASLLGVILMSIANRYAAEGDTMRMLVAVLNSNFWLSTHVITVTIGYSACLLAGAIGHVWMVRALLPGGQDKPERLKEIGSMIFGTICFGLLFSFIGTVLGGIWADQSWGRFWGWDPKENGALLIVIWCIVLLHARQWGFIRGPGMALGSVFGAIVVSLAWFGVNLLNVGLHSYGFTDGAANKLFGYIGAELLFMAVTGIWLKWGRRGGKAGPPTRAPAAAAAKVG